ncbi:phage tail tube protein [Microbulbifer sp. OS29]|uniref:Phage tail tube protein n=1 Tax=Microbulbifer okhotskensis TaxID=2926617 RepID=A0A9X2ESG5_9GAMM|nr:phage tail tube protein [Microbulbifer okhotskensis]MCO1336971.1 phage tail tube protein [Microbulbifer okhotskensis]
MADGSQHSMAYVAESTYGVTPASPTFKAIRNKGTTLALTKEGSADEELRDDRQITDYRHMNKSVGGDININLSYGSFDDFLEGATMGAWDSNKLVVGKTRRSFTVERKFGDISDKPYHRFTGCELNTLNLTVAPGARVSGSFGVIGKDMSPEAAALSGSTYGDETTTQVFDSFKGVIKEGAAGLAVMTEVTLTLDNGLESRFVVGSDTTIQPGVKRSNVTGQLSAYFENSVLLEKFLDEDSSSLEFSLVDAAGNSYIFTLPKIKYTGGQVDVSGEGAIILPLPFQAVYDETEGTNLIIERVSA